MSKIDNKKLINLIKKSLALTDLGILYAQNEFDKTRYEELKETNLEILDLVTNDNTSFDKLIDFYLPVKDYITPKVEVRGVVLNENNEILMVSEKLDSNKWSLPGGFCDIGLSPSEVIEKELLEEAGISAEVIRLLAVLDKKLYFHPETPFHSYQIFFLCKVERENFKSSFEIDDVRFFSVDNLPKLSTVRVTKEEILLVHKLANDESLGVHFS